MGAGGASGFDRGRTYHKPHGPRRRRRGARLLVPAGRRRAAAAERAAGVPRGASGFARTRRSMRSFARGSATLIARGARGRPRRLVRHTRAARSRACSCSINSRATRFATRRSRSQATRARSPPPATRSRAASTARSRPSSAGSCTCRSSTANRSPTRSARSRCSARSRSETGLTTTRSTGRSGMREVISRFGRFPHRNAILGRASTPEEIAVPALARHRASDAASRAVRWPARRHVRSRPLRAPAPRRRGAARAGARRGAAGSRRRPAASRRARRPRPPTACAMLRARGGRVSRRSSSTRASLHAPARATPCSRCEELRARGPVAAAGADRSAPTPCSGCPTWHRWHELFELAQSSWWRARAPGLRSTRCAPSCGSEWAARDHRRRRDAARHARAAPSVVQPVTPQPISATAIRAALARGAVDETSAVCCPPPFWPILKPTDSTVPDPDAP